MKKNEVKISVDSVLVLQKGIRLDVTSNSTTNLPWRFGGFVIQVLEYFNLHQEAFTASIA